MNDPEQEPQIGDEHVLIEQNQEQEVSPKDLRPRDSKESLGEVFGDGTSFKNDKFLNRNHTFVVPTSTSTG